MTLHGPAIQTPPAPRALWISLAISLVIHLVAVVLSPHSASRPPPQAPLHVRLAIHATQMPSQALAAPAATPGQPPSARQNSSPVVTTDAPVSPQAAAAPPLPTVDVQAAFAAARSIGKTWSAPRQLGLPPLPPMTVETVIARATRPDTLVEEHDAAGNWVQRFGRSRCVVALAHVPHFMRGMVIPAQCEVSKS
ncbi:MAG: hypothetical protein M0Q22_07655 [Sulfuritalea sp.]|jgi:hypothetical protein|nr:hypothetical protein [Sulfuritalea sp.]